MPVPFADAPTACDRCRTPGHDKAAGRRDSERIRADARKTPLQRGRRALRVPLRGTRETGHTAHKPLTGSETVEKVPLTGLSSGSGGMGLRDIRIIEAIDASANQGGATVEMRR